MTRYNQLVLGGFWSSLVVLLLLLSSSSSRSTCCHALIVEEEHQPSSCEEKEWDVVALTDDYYFWKGAYEDNPLINSLQKLGRRATRVSIQDWAFDFNSTKAIVVRSAWSKYEYLSYYKRFLDEVEANPTVSLFNPRKLLRWHHNKALYLQQLKLAGINIPTTYTIPKTTKNLPSLWHVADELGCYVMVMKPASGNAGGGIERITPKNMDQMQSKLFYLVRGYHGHEEENYWGDDEEVELHADADDVFIQCYQKQIKTKCERGVIFIGGEVTHGIRKCPAKNDYRVHEGFGGSADVYDPTPEEVIFAKQVAQAIEYIVGETPAYLRVDVFNDNNDELALMELAAGTAQLWLSQRPEAADVFARYLDQYLKHQEEASHRQHISSIITQNKPEAPVIGMHNATCESDSIRVGSRVAVWWESDQRYYDGKITRIERLTEDDNSVHDHWYVRYDDGAYDWVDPTVEKVWT